MAPVSVFGSPVPDVLAIGSAAGCFVGCGGRSSRLGGSPPGEASDLSAVAGVALGAGRGTEGIEGNGSGMCRSSVHVDRPVTTPSGVAEIRSVLMNEYHFSIPGMKR